MSDRRIVNASPLILLSKAGRLDLLRTGAGEVVIPEPVLQEIDVKGDSDLTVQAIHASGWIDQRCQEPFPAPFLPSGLGVPATLGP